MRTDKRLYLTEDRTRVVPEGHKDARWLFAFAGDEIDDADAARYGLTKQRAKPTNKQRKPAANKAKKK